MRLWPWATAFGAASAATLIYGALEVANRVSLERWALPLPRWPADKAGFRIGFIADLHVRDEHSVSLVRRATDLLLSEQVDVYVIGGDFVASYRPESPWQLERALSGFREASAPVLGVPGNHDYWDGDPRLLHPVLEDLGIRLLRNQVYRENGVTWVGIDSANALAADPFTTMMQVQTECPVVAIWHEPDVVDYLPSGAALMLSGHSHGGQFRFPWGWTPMHTYNGETYVEGFYPEAPTPLFVTRGIGTTGPPSRLGVLPEIAILTLVPA